VTLIDLQGHSAIWSENKCSLLSYRSRVSDRKCRRSDEGWHCRWHRV